MIDLSREADLIAPLLVGGQRWHELQVVDTMSPGAKKAAIRLNALGSLFFFSKIVLGHMKMTPSFHREFICKELESERLKAVLEIPRAHYKSTIASVSAPMWWALPFTYEDELNMRALGYRDEWIKWMNLAHSSSTRTLISSEIIKNARKFSDEIAGHYESNALFRFLFAEIIPKRTDKWNQDSRVHNRIDGIYHGEGTFDFIGASGALQSRHYDRIIEDDLVGEKAIRSDLVMEKVIDWHRKLPGAFDSKSSTHVGDQLIIGNRWSNRDLNAWIRENEPSYRVLNHSAEGGCCAHHPLGVPIFPEEFSIEKLREIRSTEGSYHYSAQYLNNPVAPEAVRFKSSWLRYFKQDAAPVAPPSAPNQMKDGTYIANYQQLPVGTFFNPKIEADKAEARGASPARLREGIYHETQAGEIIDPIRASELDRVAILDPNHSALSGRSRHAIVVLGILNRPPEPRRIYLLDCWAGATTFEEMIERLIGTRPGSRGLAVKWKVHHVYLESEVAGQQGWKFYFKDRVSHMGVEATFTIRALKTDRSSGGKDKRILGMEPIYENGLFWIRRTGQEDFLTEYEQYPNGRTNDILDVIGYAPQTWGPGSRSTTRDFVKDELQRRQSMIQSIGSAGY